MLPAGSGLQKEMTLPQPHPRFLQQLIRQLRSFKTAAKLIQDIVIIVLTTVTIALTMVSEAEKVGNSARRHQATQRVASAQNHSSAHCI
jgi:cell division protein ZapA (FtsZ GTPase activity inhibitor)